MDNTKIDSKDLDSPQELSVRGLGFVIVFLLRSGIEFLCASTVRAIQ